MTDSNSIKEKANPRPRLLWALRRGFGDYYDKLGLTVLGSVIMALFALCSMTVTNILSKMAPGPILLLVGAMILWYGLAFGWAGNLLTAHRIAYFEQPGPDAWLDIFRIYGIGILKLASLQLFVTVLIFFDSVFFLARNQIFLQMVGIVTGYILLLWLMSMLWQWPYLIIENQSTLKIVKKSALVMIDNLFFTIGTFFVTITLGIILHISIAGGVAAGGGLLACFTVRAHREILKKYGIAEDEPDTVEDGGWPDASEPPRRLNPRDLDTQR